MDEDDHGKFRLDRAQHNYSFSCVFEANDAYLEMAIGNAPWPIGVTMVGIHARTGREKIFARNVAHVLNDETQRKYIQVSFIKKNFSKFQKQVIKLHNFVDNQHVENEICCFLFKLFLGEMQTMYLNICNQYSR